MTAQTIHVSLNERSYDIVIASSDPVGLGPFARQGNKSKRAIIVADPNTRAHADVASSALVAAGYQPIRCEVPAGEQQKCLQTASELYDRFADAHVDRKTLVVAVGGGVIGDLAGFVASTYARGLPLLMVPTTLLAMVDSSVGGKVGVNHPRAKNLIGCFYQPIGVWIDTATLATLPDREYRSGLAEVVKYGVILDDEFFAYLEKHAEGILQRQPEPVRNIVARCCRLKADVVEKDEREETGLRVVLNYGHTFGHAFETIGGYGKWLHGEAIAAGMLCAAQLAESRRLVPNEFVSRQRHLLERFGLLPEPQRWSIDALLETMRNDKKAVTGRWRLVLPRRLGEVALFDDVSEAEVQKALGAVVVV